MQNSHHPTPRSRNVVKKQGTPDTGQEKVKIINLSGGHLAPGEKSLMMKGPSLCPSTTGTYLDAKAELTEYTRKLKQSLREILVKLDNICLI